MMVIPAIDLLEGQAVRLLQGDPRRKSVFSEDPVEVARGWFRLGAQRIHVVDLDGSWAGFPRNKGLIQAMVSAVPIPIQLGGGIRDLEIARNYLDAGVERIVLGTVAVERPELVKRACELWPGRVVVAIDSRGGSVTVRGWTESTSVQAVELALSLQEVGVAAFIHTDVERDGTRRGINLGEVLKLARAVRVPVIASGGVGSLEDIRKLAQVADGCGIEGVIVGRALYDGSLDLKQAMEVARERF